MFRPAFAHSWYPVPGVNGLKLSGDLRFRGPGGIREMRHDSHGRPYVLANRASPMTGEGQHSQRRVMLHRAVMSVVLGRPLTPDELVCHRDDDPRNNWPESLHVGDRKCKAADSLRNGRQPRATGTRARRWTSKCVRSGWRWPGASGDRPGANLRCAPEHDQSDQTPRKALESSRIRISDANAARGNPSRSRSGPR